MLVSRYEPWNLLEQFHNDLNHVFSSPRSRFLENGSISATDWVPAVDIKEEENRYLIHADIPGVDARDVDVSMDNSVLTIQGKRASEAEEEREGYKRFERVRGSFLRRFTFPDTADTTKITARVKDGVLTIEIPKHEKEQPRRITVEG
mgnify:FL=1